MKYAAMRLSVALVGLLLCAGASSARVGIPIDLAWDFTTSPPAGAVPQTFQVQACMTLACNLACTPIDLPGASIPVPSGSSPSSSTTAPNWGSPVVKSTFPGPYSLSLRTVTFPAVSARYVRIRILTEVLGDCTSSAAEFSFSAGGTAIPQSALKIVSVDSQETQGENGAATNAIDGNPATLWTTQWFSACPPQPHEIVIDLGSIVQLDTMNYLPRQDNVHDGTFGDYELYTLTTLGSTSGGLTYEDPCGTGGAIYLYQVVTVGQVNGQPARSAPSNRICIYDRALNRGRPSIPMEPDEP